MNDDWSREQKEAIDFKRGQKFATFFHDLDTRQSILAQIKTKHLKLEFVFFLKVVSKLLIVVKAKQSGWRVATLFLFLADISGSRDSLTTHDSGDW